MSLGKGGVHSLGCVSVRVHGSGCARARARTPAVLLREEKGSRAMCVLFSLEESRSGMAWSSALNGCGGGEGVASGPLEKMEVEELPV